MEDLKTIHYTTQDPLPNLRVKVTMTRLSATKAHASDQGTADTAAGGGHQDGQSSNAAAGRDASPVRTAATRQLQTLSRTFVWQEKVYSKAELVAAQAEIRASQQQQGRFFFPKKTAQFGSHSRIATDKLLTEDPEGSLIFSYVQTDDYCDTYEIHKEVTTSKHEGKNHLVQVLLKKPRNRQKVLNFRSMFIMADLGDEHTVAGCNEKVLLSIRAFPDGSFAMQPGFSVPGSKYRFEDDHGGIYEYTLENASKTDTPSLERRANKLAAAVAARAEEIRRGSHGMDFSPPPGPDASALRLMLYGELMSAAGFQRDHLYVEYVITYDPQIWFLEDVGGEPSDKPGVIKGVTHVSKMVQYPADPSDDTPPTWVAHFAHPLEVVWVAAQAPPPGKWPVLLLQVCSYDPWDRATTEGYGWLQLGQCCPGSTTQVISTWKPLGTRHDQQRAFFIGGSPELEDMVDVIQPKGFTEKGLNKYGFKTETSGLVKVRLHALIQTGAAPGTSPCKLALNHPGRSNRGGQRQQQQRQGRKELSLAVVLERARARLMEARGGEVAVREGLVADKPVIRMQPKDVDVDEGGTATFEVAAGGFEPLQYQWYKDDRKLYVATSSTAQLILVDVAAADSGTYHCQVTNKDGSASSRKAILNIKRISRLQRATQSIAGVDPSQDQAQLGSTLDRRTTISRALGQGVPYSSSPRQSAALGGDQQQSNSSRSSSLGIRTGDGSPSNLSPLRRTAGGGGSSKLRQGWGSREGSRGRADTGFESGRGVAVAGLARGNSSPLRPVTAGGGTDPGSPQRQGRSSRGGAALAAEAAPSSGTGSPLRREALGRQRQQQAVAWGAEEPSSSAGGTPAAGQSDLGEGGSSQGGAVSKEAVGAWQEQLEGRLPPGQQSRPSSSHMGQPAADGAAGELQQQARLAEQPLPRSSEVKAGASSSMGSSGLGPERLGGRLRAGIGLAGQLSPQASLAARDGAASSLLRQQQEEQEPQSQGWVADFVAGSSSTAGPSPQASSSTVGGLDGGASREELTAQQGAAAGLGRAGSSSRTQQGRSRVGAAGRDSSSTG